MNSIDEPETENKGGLAPEHRQCRYTLAGGRHCRRWAVRGHQLCHQHARWMETRVDGAIEVPLLEDPAAITLVLSQTVRQLAWGRIPPINGRAIIAACRAAQINFAHTLAEAKFQLHQSKFQLKLRQLKLTPQDLLPASNSAALAFDTPPPASDAPPSHHPLDDAPLPPVPEIPATLCDPCIAALAAGADESQLDCKHCPAFIAGNLLAPQLPDPRNAPETPQPRLDRAEKPDFLHLKQQWDSAIAVANKHQVGLRQQRLAAREDRATPFDSVLLTPPSAPPPPIPAPNAERGSGSGAPTVSPAAA